MYHTVMVGPKTHVEESLDEPQEKRLKEAAPEEADEVRLQGCSDIDLIWFDS